MLLLHIQTPSSASSFLLQTPPPLFLLLRAPFWQASSSVVNPDYCVDPDDLVAFDGPPVVCGPPSPGGALSSHSTCSTLATVYREVFATVTKTVPLWFATAGVPYSRCAAPRASVHRTPAQRELRGRATRMRTRRRRRRRRRGTRRRRSRCWRGRGSRRRARAGSRRRGGVGGEGDATRQALTEAKAKGWEAAAVMADAYCRRALDDLPEDTHSHQSTHPRPRVEERTGHSRQDKTRHVCRVLRGRSEERARNGLSLSARCEAPHSYGARGSRHQGAKQPKGPCGRR